MSERVFSLGTKAKECVIADRDDRHIDGETMTAASGFSLNDPSVIADPYPYYAWLRDHAPVFHSDELDLWVVSRYDDVVAVLRDSQRFSSDLGGISSGLHGNPFNPSMKVPGWLGRLPARIPWLRVLLTSDPPEHTVLRRKVSRAFTPRRMAAWETRIREITARLVDDMVAARNSGPIDLVRDFASPLPTVVIAEMMGIPAARQDDFKRWSDHLVDGLLTGGSIIRLATSATQISLFFARIVRRRRRRPGDDLISLLVAGDDDTALNPAEIVTFCILLLVAGNETTTNLIANAVLALFAHPEQWHRLRADPTLIANAIEETLRYDGPGQGLLRVTTTDVTIDAVTIPAGCHVLPLIASANRDPRHWDDPDSFRLDRDLDDHLAFGSGIHFCIGNALARLEGRVALETLVRRAPGLRRIGEPVRINSPVLRGLRSLPVAVGPAPSD